MEKACSMQLTDGKVAYKVAYKVSKYPKVPKFQHVPDCFDATGLYRQRRVRQRECPLALAEKNNNLH